jgi:hypothetical protein
MKKLWMLAALVPAVAFGQEAPVCHCQAQCDAMWAQATKDVENASGMRLRIATDALLETYVSNNASRQTGTVTKTPIGGGAYTIALALEPWYVGQKDVQGVMAQNITHFNQRQNAIAESTKCPAG